MESYLTKTTVGGLRDSQKAALISLLSDEDAGVYQAVRDKILSTGPVTRQWLQPHALSTDPLLRRRTQEIIRHFDRHAADNAFLGFCLSHGEEFDLEEAAWMLARTQYPDINIEAYQALLDTFVAELRQRVVLYSKPNQILTKINEYLFTELGFVGNEENYYDPENSFLNRVLDRRTGNPLSLCLFYILIARRLHLPVAGVAMPGHFVCRYQSTADEIFIDTFNHGRLMSKADCIHHLVRGNYEINDEYLSAVSSRRIFQRVCRNLHQIYLQLELNDEATRFQRYLTALGK